MPVPVVMETALQLEPLAGEADVQRSRIGPYIARLAEGRVDHVPHPGLILRGHPRRAAEMVGMDVIDHRRAGRDLVHHRQRNIAQPDIFPQRLAARIGLGDDVIVEIMHIERGDRVIGEASRRPA